MSENEWIADETRKPCAKCSQEHSVDALTPEGECFTCSTGDGESKITATAIRESMANIARNLGDKTNLTMKSVAKRIYEANKDDKNSGGVN